MSELDNLDNIDLNLEEDENDIDSHELLKSLEKELGEEEDDDKSNLIPTLSTFQQGWLENTTGNPGAVLLSDLPNPSNNQIIVDIQKNLHNLLSRDLYLKIDQGQLIEKTIGLLVTLFQNEEAKNREKELKKSAQDQKGATSDEVEKLKKDLKDLMNFSKIQKINITMALIICTLVLSFILCSELIHLLIYHLIFIKDGITQIECFVA